ncbi:MAG TPA: alpha/beta hydrolase [Candidatus Didemnitutus sp.]|nr:alpha/beta hydrolase [Candidatus Didemnitutus sp.]
MSLRLLTLVALAASLLVRPLGAADAGTVVPLWPGDAPGSEGRNEPEKVRVTPAGEHIYSSIHHPSLTVFLPKANATGAGILICPGGGHRELWMDHEGFNVARWFADHGVAAFILKYRLAREEGSTYQVSIHSLADAQRALRVVRSRATEWGVDPARVGIIGFSAGGELAALAGMRFGGPLPANPDAIDKLDDKPAFQALIYPGNTDAIHPARDVPPAFLVCGYDDNEDIAEGLARVYLRFKQVGVPAELHIYTGAGHGFGIRSTNHFPAASWPDRLLEWLGDRGFLKAAK